MTARPLSLTVNGKQIGPIDVPDDMMMQNFLHEYLNLTGSRMGCGGGHLPRLHGHSRKSRWPVGGASHLHQRGTFFRRKIG